MSAGLNAIALSGGPNFCHPPGSQLPKTINHPKTESQNQMDTPKPDSSTATLLKATSVKEVFSAHEASTLIQSGAKLVAVGVAHHPTESDIIFYSLIWTGPRDEMPSEWF